jgi:DNA repair exonuclease SbcCD ATPase subunit
MFCLMFCFLLVNLKLEADSQFVDRSAWQSEIDDWINKIKKIERNLESWEQHLHSRELWVKEQEKKLEQQFRVVVSSHTVICFWQLVMYVVW